jgi:hypothetical protein
MARSKNAPKLKWEWRNCIDCDKKFRYTIIEGEIEKESKCKNCSYKECLICKNMHQKIRSCCSIECSKKLREKTNFEKYGVANAFASDEIKQKIKQKLIENYGVEHPLLSTEIKQKIATTCLKKYGVINPAQSDEIKNKIKETCNEKYGTDYIFQTDDFKLKAKTTKIKRYGVEYLTQLEYYKKRLARAAQSQERIEKIKKTFLQRYGVQSALQLPVTREECNNEASLKKRRETMRKNRSWTSSKPEDTSYLKLCEIFQKVERHIEINRWDIDFYVPEIDTYINMNGIYWHGREKTEKELSESSSRQDKTILQTKRRDNLRFRWFKENNKNLVVIWEDEIELICRDSFNRF